MMEELIGYFVFQILRLAGRSSGPLSASGPKTIGEAPQLVAKLLDQLLGHSKPQAHKPSSCDPQGRAGLQIRDLHIKIINRLKCTWIYNHTEVLVPERVTVHDGVHRYLLSEKPSFLLTDLSNTKIKTFFCLFLTECLLEIETESTLQ